MTWFFQNHKWKIRHNTKPQATSSKPHAPVFRSRKQQAQPEVASDKPQAVENEELEGLKKFVRYTKQPI